MGRTLQGAAEPPHPWLTTRHPLRRDRTVHQLWQTLKGKDQEGHHDPEEWKGCRTGWDTSKRHQSRHRDSKIWEKGEELAQWKEGIIIKLPKKGDLRDCSNYRGIMLLSTPGKVLNRVLLERMKEAVDPKLQDQQAGFWQNRSCANQIASLRIIVEQSLEWKSPSTSTS